MGILLHDFALQIQHFEHLWGRADFVRLSIDCHLEQHDPHPRQVGRQQMQPARFAKGQLTGEPTHTAARGVRADPPPAASARNGGRRPPVLNYGSDEFYTLTHQSTGLRHHRW